jgi:hypothetical protein
MTPTNDKANWEDRPSCEAGLSRKKFVELVLKRAAIAGAVLSAPKIIDKFLVAQPAQAMPTSTQHGQEA